MKTTMKIVNEDGVEKLIANVGLCPEVMAKEILGKR